MIAATNRARPTAQTARALWPAVITNPNVLKGRSSFVFRYQKGDTYSVGSGSQSYSWTVEDPSLETLWLVTIVINWQRMKSKTKKLLIQESSHLERNGYYLLSQLTVCKIVNCLWLTMISWKSNGSIQASTLLSLAITRFSTSLCLCHRAYYLLHQHGIGNILGKPCSITTLIKIIKGVSALFCLH